MADERADRVKVRTTFRPDQDVEMDQVEAEDLRRQGLLVEDQKKAAAQAPREQRSAQ